MKTKPGLVREKIWRYNFPLVVFLFFLCANAIGEVDVVVEANDNGPNLVRYKMIVTAAAEPTPAMQYRFTVQPHKTIAGNAVTHYLRSYGENSLDAPLDYARKQYGMTFYDWGKMNKFAIEDLPLDKVREACGMFDGYINNHINRATQCRYCEWGLAEEDLNGVESLRFLLPSVQQTRSISRVLGLKTRLAVAERRYKDAVDLLRMNYQLGQNVSKMKFVVSGLVGIAEVGIANESAIDLIAADSSPNLYWAFAELPRPIINLRESLRLEMSLGDRLFSGLGNVEELALTKEQWAAKLKATYKEINELMNYVGHMDSPEYAPVAISLISFPAAKERLQESGMKKTEVDQMAVGQVLLIDAMRQYRSIADDYEKTCYLPHGSAMKLSNRIERERMERKKEVSLGAILADTLLPAIQQVQQASTRLEWQRNALMVVEAIRMHVASTGELPKSLDDIVIVPTPINPTTGKPYVYWLDGETAVVDLPASDGIPGMAQRFELKFTK